MSWYSWPTLRTRFSFFWRLQGKHKFPDTAKWVHGLSVNPTRSYASTRRAASSERHDDRQSLSHSSYVHKTLGQSPTGAEAERRSHCPGIESSSKVDRFRPPPPGRLHRRRRIRPPVPSPSASLSVVRRSGVCPFS